jgi:pyridoxine/pyridoxamine 5'-phosphate oxidase
MSTHQTASGLTVERVSTSDRGCYYVVKDRGSKIPLDAWNSHSKQEIRNLDQLAAVLARYGDSIPAEFQKETNDNG